MKKEDVSFALDSILAPVSLFEPVYNESGDAIFVMDQVSDEKNTDENWIEEISLKEAMRKLNERERHILNLRFFKGRTQIEVANEIGVPLKKGYNGDLTSAQNGYVGGYMVKKMIEKQEQMMAEKNQG